MQVGNYSVAQLVLRMSLDVPSLFSLSTQFGLLQPLLFRVFCIASWDSLSGLCALWGSFPSLLLGRCTQGWLVQPVIGFPLLGVHPSISIVKLIMIGYHCNCLDGKLNCWVFAHWVISVTIMYQFMLAVIGP